MTEVRTAKRRVGGSLAATSADAACETRINSLTFVLRRRWDNQDLFPMFVAIVSRLWRRARTV
ncbi:MAG: hypothetical protein ACLQFR_28555 [Streptosporangiaceae bacterium]